MSGPAAPAGQAAPPLLVIYNPVAGRGRAARSVERLRSFWGDQATFRPTAGPGHAEELAREAALAGVRWIGAAGGDGAVHEVANGLLAAQRPDAVLCVLPLGSANDFCHALLRPGCWSAASAVAGPTFEPPSVDVGRVRTPEGRARFFVNVFGLGFNGAVTQEARRIRFLRGVPLYTLALLRALRRRYTTQRLQLQLGELEDVRETLTLTLCLGRREGSFVLAPQARLDDGRFDYLHVGRLSRLRLATYIPRMITGRLPLADTAVATGFCAHARIQAGEPLVVHLDGEFFCQQEDNVRELEVELLPRRLRVLACPAAGAAGERFSQRLRELIARGSSYSPPTTAQP